MLLFLTISASHLVSMLAFTLSKNVHIESVSLSSIIESSIKFAYCSTINEAKCLRGVTSSPYSVGLNRIWQKVKKFEEIY